MSRRGQRGRRVVRKQLTFRPIGQPNYYYLRAAGLIVGPPSCPVSCRCRQVCRRPKHYAKIRRRVPSRSKVGRAASNSSGQLTILSNIVGISIFCSLFIYFYGVISTENSFYAISTNTRYKHMQFGFQHCNENVFSTLNIFLFNNTCRRCWKC